MTDNHCMRYETTIGTGFGTICILHNERHVWALDQDGVPIDAKYLPAILAEEKRQKEERTS